MTLMNFSPMAFAEAAQCIPEFRPMALMNFSPKAFAEAAQCISEAAQCIADFSPMALLNFIPMPFAEAAQCIPEAAQCIAEFSPMALLNFSPMPFAEEAQCIPEASVHCWFQHGDTAGFIRENSQIQWKKRKFLLIFSLVETAIYHKSKCKTECEALVQRQQGLWRQ